MVEFIQIQLFYTVETVSDEYVFIDKTTKMRYNICVTFFKTEVRNLEISRVSAIVLAVLAAVLVIAAGKSCAEDISKTNKQSVSKRPKSTTFYNDNTDYPYQNDDSYYVYETDAETVTEKDYEEVTNMLGNVVATVPITTTEEVTEAVTTKELSILEAYEERHTTTTSEQQDDYGYTTIDIDSIEIPTKIIIEMY